MSAQGHSLYKRDGGAYVVTSDKLKNAHLLPTVEAACEVLEMIGIKDDEIDLALADMVSKGNSRAMFGIAGTFICSDTAVCPLVIPKVPA